MNFRFLKVLLLIGSLAFIGNNSFGQIKLIKKMLSGDSDSIRKSSLLPLPVLAYSQETGFEIGGISLYSFYTDYKDSITRASRIAGAATFTTKNQANLQIKTDIWSPKNKFHYTGEIKYKNFPFNFYGIGNSTLKSDEIPLDHKLFKLNAGIEKQFGESRYSGLNMSYEYYRFKDISGKPFLQNDPTIYGKNGGKILALGFTQIFDNRNSNTYTSKGSYVKINYSYAPDIFGGDNFAGSILKMDFRNFQSFNKTTSIGFNAIFQSINGENTPFYLLPQLGNDEMMRAYYTGRYRDENLMAIQSELRLKVHPRFGLVGFAGTGNVFKRREFSLKDLKPSVGGGLRYFFDIEKGLSVRLDYGIGEKNAAEKRQSGFYISLGEAF